MTARTALAATAAAALSLGSLGAVALWRHARDAITAPLDGSSHVDRDH